MQASAADQTGHTTVPPPVPPDDEAAWYAPTVREQYEIHPRVVTTIRETDSEITYDVREPGLTERIGKALAHVLPRFAEMERPRTREGAAERMCRGFEPKYERIIDRETDLSPAARRRLAYHVARARALGDLTPYALDGRITAVERTDGELVVGTEEYGGARTGTEPTQHWNRFTSEAVRRYTVSFLEWEIPVEIYRTAQRSDPFTMQYTVHEPDLLDGDQALINVCKERLWETNVVSRTLDGRDSQIQFVRERSEQLLSRLVTTETRLESLRHYIQTQLAAFGLLGEPQNDSYDSDRLNDLVYYVLRDYVGHGELTIPIHDPWLEDIEANRVGERVKVIPRGFDERVPTNLIFASESEFENVVTQLAGADGVELNASNPSAKVNLSIHGTNGDDGERETIRCAVALGTISEGGPHISIRKQSSDPLTAIDLVKNGSIPTEFVALLWLLFEHHGVVIFSGSTGVGKTTLMNAHIPFIPHDDRPISIDEGSREVRLPHETGISLSTRDHQEAYKRVTMADLMTEANYLNPDVEIIAEINTPESFATFGECISTGHGIIGTTHAETMERLVNRIIEQGLPSYLLSEIDLIVFPRYVDGERYVGRCVELIDGDDSTQATIERDETTVRYNTILEQTPKGEFRFGESESRKSEGSSPTLQLFEQLADRTDKRVGEIEASFRRKHRYVNHLCEEDVTEIDALFEYLTAFSEETEGQR